MTHLGTTKQGTEIYKEDKSHLSTIQYYQTRRMKSGAWEHKPGLTWSQIEKLIRKEGLVAPLREIGE